MTDWNGTVPTILAGYEPSGDDWSAILAELSAISGAWTDWTPTLTNITQGNGTVSARYRRVGKTVDYRFKFTLGSGSAMGTSPTFSVPVGPYTAYADRDTTGMAMAYDSSAGTWWESAPYWTSGSIIIGYWVAAGTLAAITSTTPFTWATSDVLLAYGTYETA